MDLRSTARQRCALFAMADAAGRCPVPSPASLSTRAALSAVATIFYGIVGLSSSGRVVAVDLDVLGRISSIASSFAGIPVSVAVLIVCPGFHGVFCWRLAVSPSL